MRIKHCFNVKRTVIHWKKCNQTASFNSISFPQELQQHEEAEAEKKKEAEAREHARFQSSQPFRFYPEERCLAAEPWREPYEARLEMDARLKLARLRDKEEAASKALVDDLFKNLLAEIDSVSTFANGNSNDLRYLEERIALLLGQPIPHLPPSNGIVEDEAESVWNWNI